MRLLEKASNIAVILAALAVTGTVMYDRVVLPPQARALLTDTFSARYTGKRIPVGGFESGTPAVFFVRLQKLSFLRR